MKDVERLMHPIDWDKTRSYGEIPMSNLIGKHIEWFITDDKSGEKVQRKGTIIKEYPGWDYEVAIECDDGEQYYLKLCTTVDPDTGKYIYKPEYTIEGLSKKKGSNVTD